MLSTIGCITVSLFLISSLLIKKLKSIKNLLIVINLSSLFCLIKSEIVIMAVEQVKLCYTLPRAFAASSSSRSMHFGDVSETSLDHVTRNASALRYQEA